MDTVAVLLHSGCIDQAGLDAIWNRGKRYNSHYVAFLEARRCPDSINASAALVDPAVLETLRGLGTPLADQLAEALSGRGRSFIEAAHEVLSRPETQEVVSRTLNAIGGYFQVPGTPAEWSKARASILDRYPDLAPATGAFEALSTVSEALTLPVFSRSTAIGSLMRRKIDPITAPIQAHLGSLLAAKVS
jgi:hypothetical protein